MSLIEISHLRKEYPDATPLKDVNATIERGEVISIIGPSGTGKSTFLRCLNRLETPTSGSILIDGVDMCDPKTDLAAMRRKVGMVFQSFNLFGHMLVAENVMYGPVKLLGKPKQEAYEEALELLGRVGLKERALRWPHELSGGQKQRVAIARALAMHPEILLFDEPTSALDPAMVSEVLSVMKDLAEEGYTMLAVTHEMRFARDVSSRVFYMDRGEVWEQGSPDVIFENPVRDETREFIFRIRNWNHEVTLPDYDHPGTTASLEEFCARQFLGRRLSNSCQLVVEEMLNSRFAPAVRGTGGTAALKMMLSVAEGGETAHLELDCSDLVDKGVPIELLSQDTDEISGTIIAGFTKLLESDDPLKIRYEIS